MIHAFVIPELWKLRQENCPKFWLQNESLISITITKFRYDFGKRLMAHLFIQLWFCAWRDYGVRRTQWKLQTHFGAETPHFLEGKQLLSSDYIRNSIQFPTFQVYEPLLLFSEINYIQEKGELAAPKPPAPPLCQLSVCGEGCWLGLGFTLGEFFF